MEFVRRGRTRTNDAGDAFCFTNHSTFFSTKERDKSVQLIYSSLYAVLQCNVAGYLSTILFKLAQLQYSWQYYHLFYQTVYFEDLICVLRFKMLITYSGNFSFCCTVSLFYFDIGMYTQRQIFRSRQKRL